MTREEEVIKAVYRLKRLIRQMEKISKEMDQLRLFIKENS